MYLVEIYPSLRRWKTALGDFLDTLAGAARETINDGYYSVEPERRISPVSLRQRILQHAGNSVISEIKPASPSLGDIRSDVDPSETACMMETGGAAGISVLTEPTRFKGSLENLTQARKAVTIPVLMKDFILCREQVKAAFNIGADAILLIQALFDRDYCDTSVEEIIVQSHIHGLEVLLEVHSIEEFEKAVKTDADLIGINNRNLKTLTIDTGVTQKILESCKVYDKTVISESGIKTYDDLRYLRDLGVQGYLIGSSIMQSEDIENAVRGFVQA